jgi:hypothetical protein
MGDHSSFDRTFGFARRPAAAPLLALFVFPGAVCASNAASDAAANTGVVALAGSESAATDRTIGPPSYGPPGATPSSRLPVQ